jgi:hypothetical protein
MLIYITITNPANSGKSLPRFFAFVGGFRRIKDNPIAFIQPFKRALLAMVGLHKATRNTAFEMIFRYNNYPVLRFGFHILSTRLMSFRLERVAKKAEGSDNSMSAGGNVVLNLFQHPTCKVAVMHIGNIGWLPAAWGPETSSG